MKKAMVITLCVSAIVSILAIVLNGVTHDSRWVFADIMLGFIFLLAAGLGLGANAGDGGRSVFLRKKFQEMYQDQPGKIQKLNKKAATSSIYCLCIGLPNFLLPLVAAVLHSYH
ncbi:hypothetical protein [Alicyclobacillus mengziensis]|uniref:Uncharacterized protein n=1 Tax=Alicyclobacillus mengziensis TaxID=2931921 RepID=A0A9X7W3C7_9BACL|nr:hypothetical protein [Alicyclobacillus mengziensis]QSO48548.1 hypothetical protein JZ786_06070 [Alicyclobacillus mengziensis]